MSGPSDQFVAFMTNMENLLAQQAEYLAGNHNNAWMLPPEEYWNGDLKDPEEKIKPFKDEQLNALYIASHLASDGVGITMAQEYQIAYYMMMQRAFCSRHSNPTRALTISTGRRLAHKEGLHSGIVEHMQDLIDAGEAVV